LSHLPRFVSLVAALIVTASQWTVLSGFPARVQTHHSVSSPSADTVSDEELPVITVTAHGRLRAALNERARTPRKES